MSNEREQKYYLTENTFRKINKSKIIEKLGIIQWYQNGDEDKRYRLTLKKLPTGYFQEWTYTEKKETDDPSTRDEKEYSVSPEKIAKEFEEFKNYNMVSKIRYVFKKDPEIVIDEFLSPYGHKINDDNIKGLQYLLEIEEKENPITDFDEALKKVDFPIDLLKSVDAEDDRYKNKNLATKFEGKESTLDIIEYVKNRLKGDITLVMTQGNSLINTIRKETIEKSDEETQERYNKINKQKEMIKDIFNKETFNEIDDINLFKNISAEVETYNTLIKQGYSIKEIKLFVFGPYLETTKNINSNHKYFINDISYAGAILKYIFEEKYSVKVEPLSVKSKSSKYLFDIAWEKIDKILEKTSKDKLVIDITGGFKNFGIVLSIYSLFKNIPFYYKYQEYAIEEFPAFGLDWDYNYFDEISSVIKTFNLKEKNNTINLNDFLQMNSKISKLFAKDSNDSFKPFYPLTQILDDYQDKRDMPFGFGDGFLQIFYSEDQPVIMKNMRNYIESMTKQKWSKQWIGDLIPETVEHSQRHSKRLLDFTANLLNVIGEDNFVPFDFKNSTYQNTEVKYKFVFYFILAVAINVHDLGHTYSKFKYKKDKTLFLDKYPSLIRDLHNELTVQLIEEGIISNLNIFDILTPDKINEQNEKEITYVDLEEIFKEKKNEIIDAIKLVCKYHRGYLAVDKKDNSSEKIYSKIFNLDIRPLEKVLEVDYPKMDENLKKIIKHAAKWLKFIDATDVQSDRIITASHHIARLRRTKFEVLNLIEKYLIHYPESNLIYEIKEMKKYIENINTNVLTASQTDEHANYYKKIEKISKKIEDLIYYFIGFTLENNKININNPELELLDLIAFKARQFPHFDKHRSVAAIYPTWLEWDNCEKEKKINEMILHLNIFKNEFDKNNIEIPKDVLERIENSIKEELDKAKITIHNKKLKLKTTIKGRDER